MEIQVEIVSKEIINPSFPTQEHQKTINLSLIDLFSPAIYCSSLLFYNPPPNINKPEIISQNLKQSLSETLTRFYPYAGKIQNSLIECNDEGSVFIDAKVNCVLSDYLKNPDPKLLTHFLPFCLISKEAATWPVLAVQLSFFKCGGFSIGVCISHKICDAASMAVFINSWTTIARGDADADEFCPEFSGASFFPDLQLSVTRDEVALTKEKCVTKRYVFEASKITDLKTLATTEAVPNPTRVEVVTAVLFKAVTKASRSNFDKAVTKTSMSHSNVSRPSLLSQAVNLRRRNIPLLSENIMGNLLFHFTVKTEEQEIDFQRLVKELRQNKQEFDKMCEEKIRGGQESSLICLSLAKEIGDLLSEGNIEFYVSTSWCRLGLYESDFGTGKPIWVTSSGSSEFKNILLSMDAKDGEGIEIWVTLSEEDMDLVDQDQELLQFASINPSILI